jgi:hypothetical protein
VDVLVGKRVFGGVVRGVYALEEGEGKVVVMLDEDLKVRALLCDAMGFY